MHIIDSGKGITSEEMEKLFKMNGKGERTQEMNSDGLGMGLKICQRIIQ